VILTCRRSPTRRGLGANAPQVLQRAAELIPNQLKFSASPRLHPCGLTRRFRSERQEYRREQFWTADHAAQSVDASSTGTPCKGA